MRISSNKTSLLKKPLSNKTLNKTIKKQNGQRPKTHLKFVKQLIDELIGSFRVKRTKKSCSSISEDRLNGKLHVMRRDTKKDCIVCSKRKGNSGRRETTEYCDTCPNKPRMHMGDCFHKYHTKLNYKI